MPLINPTDIKRRIDDAISRVRIKAQSIRWWHLSADAPANSEILTADDTAPTGMVWGPASAPGAHDLGGASHTADTLADLNTKVSDATLDTNTASRPPSGAAGGELGGTYPNPTVDATHSGSAHHAAITIADGSHSLATQALSAVAAGAAQIGHVSTGAQTFNGVKTFGSFSVTPSSAPTTDYQVANKKYVDDNAGGGTPTLIEDADQDTAWEAEQAADEDKLRAKTGGTERVVIDSSGVAYTDTLGVKGVAPNAAIVINADPALGSVAFATGIDAGISGTSAINTTQLKAVVGSPSITAADGHTAVRGYGLNFNIVISNSSGTSTFLAAYGAECLITPSVGGTLTITSAHGLLAGFNSAPWTGGTLTITNMYGLKVQMGTAGVVATTTITTSYGVYISDGPGNVTTYTTQYGLYMADQTRGTTKFSIYQTGTSAPNVFNANTQFGSVTVSFGGGVGVIGVRNAGTNPSSNPSNGGVMYASGGALYWRGSSGTVTLIANP